MNNNTEKLYDQYSLTNYGKAPLTLVRGEGSRVWDDTGKEYLDFSTGIAVTSLGHCHPEWVRRVQEQAATFVHCSNLWRNPNQAMLAEKIADRAGPGKVFFCNSGLEANEVLLKLARLHGCEKTGKEGRQYHVISAIEAFHGRGFGGMAATPQEKIQKGFHPMLDGFRHGEINDLESFENLIDEQTAAILIEPIQGEGGIRPCEGDFLRGLRELCDRRGLLFLVDEVQCGLGRTGHFFAYEHAGVHPDGIAMAKGLGGGFPIGAVWIDQTYASLFQPGSHGCTFGGSPLACAAALAVFDAMEKEDLLNRIRKLSVPWRKSLQSLVEKHPTLLKEVRGRGFLVALGAQDDPTPIIGDLRDAGLITVPAGENAIRLLPPYTVSQDDLEKSVQIIDEVLSRSG